MIVLPTIVIALGLVAIAALGVLLGWRVHQMWVDNGGDDDLG